MAALVSQWWCRLVNAYEVKAGVMCLQSKNCMILSKRFSDVSVSRWGAIQIYLPFYVKYLTYLLTYC